MIDGKLRNYLILHILCKISKKGDEKCSCYFVVIKDLYGTRPILILCNQAHMYPPPYLNLCIWHLSNANETFDDSIVKTQEEVDEIIRRVSRIIYQEELRRRAAAQAPPSSAPRSAADAPSDPCAGCRPAGSSC